MSPKTILSVGTWDCPHAGHAIFLAGCAKIGTLTVGVNTDDYILSYKKRKPVYNFEERSNLISLLPGVEGVIPNYQDDLTPMLESLKPDFLAIGSDWGDRYFNQIRVNRFQLRKLGIQMVYLPYTPEISTTQLIERIKTYDGFQSRY